MLRKIVILLCVTIGTGWSWSPTEEDWECMSTRRLNRYDGRNDERYTQIAQSFLAEIRPIVNNPLLNKHEKKEQITPIVKRFWVTENPRFAQFFDVTAVKERMKRYKKDPQTVTMEELGAFEAADFEEFYVTVGAKIEQENNKDPEVLAKKRQIRAFEAEAFDKAGGDFKVFTDTTCGSVRKAGIDTSNCFPEMHWMELFLEGYEEPFLARLQQIAQAHQKPKVLEPSS